MIANAADAAKLGDAAFYADDLARQLNILAIHDKTRMAERAAMRSDCVRLMVAALNNRTPQSHAPRPQIPVQPRRAARR